MDNPLKTERLYEKNAYCREFSAKVISCEKEDEIYNVVLDKTAFFPEGGGQSADTGTLNGIEVVDVQLLGDTVVHKVKENFPVGSEVVGKLDFDIRFRRMQNHSGEHVLSGIVHSLFGYNNVGFHMSKSEMTVDFDGVLTAEDIEEVERRANYAVYKNLPISVSYPSTEESEHLEYRSKLDNIENLRLVTIGDIDCCACCAPHVLSTGEIGMIKVIDSTPNKGGTRLTVIAGFDAFSDYSMLNRENKKLMKTLSVSRNLVSDAADKQLELINQLRYQNAELSKRLAWAELSPITLDKCILAFSKDLSYDELRHCANMLMEKDEKMCLLFSISDEGNYIYVVSSKTEDTRPVVKALNEAFSGKGGGKPNYAQGKIVSDSEDKIKAFAEKYYR